MKKIISVSASVIITILTTFISVSAYDYYDDYYNGILDGSYAGSTSIFDSVLSSIEGLSIYDIFDTLAKNVDIGCFVVPFGLAIVTCLLGFRLYKVYSGFCGFVLGGSIGLFFAIKCESLIWLIIGLLIAIAFAYIAYQFYQIGLFILGSITAFPVFAIISLMISLSKGALIVAALLSFGVGIIVAIFYKPIIILSTAISGGSMAGTILACVIAHTRMMGLFGIIFTCLGLYYQTKVNNGLLESGSLIEKLKNKGILPESVLPHSKPVHVSASAEKCHKCGAVLTPGSEFCMECGEKVVKSSSSPSSSGKIICPVCKAENSPESDFCMNCGSKVGMSARKSSSSESQTAELYAPENSMPKPSAEPAVSSFKTSEKPKSSDVPFTPSAKPPITGISSSFKSSAKPLSEPVKTEVGGVKSSFRGTADSESGKIKSSFKNHSDTKSTGIKKSSSFRSASVSFDSDKKSD